MAAIWFSTSFLKLDNVTTTETAIDAAQTAIDDARAAITLQAEKSYAVSTTTLPTVASSTPSGQEKLVQAFLNASKLPQPVKYYAVHKTCAIVVVSRVKKQFVPTVNLFRSTENGL